jgi:CBS-domain-containing membrane protein
MATRFDDRSYERDRYESRQSRNYEDRGLLNRAGDEVRAWFGDQEAERRRRIDERWNEQRHREDRYARPRYDSGDACAGDVMTRNVMTIHPDDTVEHAARLMADCDCGALPVTDSNRKFIGMITDRDIALRVAGRGLDARRARVHEVMTHEAFACHINDSIEDCMQQMSRHQVRRMPILYDDNRLAGIISQGDLARHAGAYQGQGERRAMADMLYAVSEPTHKPYR